MTVKELSNALIKLMDEYPNTENDDISFYDDSNIQLYPLDQVSIEFDIEDIGRYVVIK